MTVCVVEVEESKALPNPKRQRVHEKTDDKIPAEFLYCQRLLNTSEDKPLPLLPPTLTNGSKCKTDLQKLKKILDDHHFRTAVVSSPRPALSFFTDSCKLTQKDTQDEGRSFLVTLFGLHPKQDDLELFFRTSVQNSLCLMLFCHRIRQICKDALQDKRVANLISGCELQCRTLGKMTTKDYTWSQIMKHAHALSSSVPRLVSSLNQLIEKAEPRFRVEYLEREYQHIALCNSSLSNTLVTLFTHEHRCTIKEISFKQSPQAKFERITIYFYDPQFDHYKPPHFLFLPCLSAVLRQGPEAVVEEMVETFWSHLIRQGYFATKALKDQFNLDLHEFFLSGLAEDTKLPVLLNAHFTPKRPLSFYLYGKAGAGKSSIVRNFQPALEATIEEVLDPEISTRFVKQNLNKTNEVLKLELELRPNNNDLSVMSIIQGRRMTKTQSKPGIVVVDLEEMPSNDPNANPNQYKVAQLISQRFDGRIGDFKADSKQNTPRLIDRGIANDASLITIFTSNYELADDSREALQRLKMFENLNVIKMTAVSGPDRVQFAETYLRQCVLDRFAELNPQCQIKVDIPVGDGDTRPLVRHLRMIAFYVSALVEGTVRFGSTIKAEVKQTGSKCTITALDRHQELKLGEHGFLLPVKHRICDNRVKEVLENLGDVVPTNEVLSVVLDFWLAKTLAPTVIVSNDKNKIRALASAAAALKDVYSIEGVNADTYKMMKSLYDPTDAENLRDDILKYGRGSNVAIEILCPSTDAQLCIREIIEDSPSMTAFSTAKSALYKEGLLFLVHVTGTITPEVRSRASIII